MALVLAWLKSTTAGRRSHRPERVGRDQALILSSKKQRFPNRRRSFHGLSVVAVAKEDSGLCGLDMSW
jgi:hypothetical protein